MPNLLHYKAIAEFLNIHQQLFKTRKDFKKLVILFTLKIAEAEAIAQVIAIINSERNANGNNIKNSLCALVSGIAQIIRVFAVKTGKKELLQRTVFSTTDLIKATDKKLISLCLDIYNETKKHAVQL